jgi:hypothetical protein
VKASFPKEYEQMLSMAQYIAIHGGALSRCESLSKSHSHPYEKPLTSQRISEILPAIKEDGIQSFFAR